jgi:hypothetical protein
MRGVWHAVGRRRAPAAVLGLLLAATGCGGYGTVSGKVTFNGQPVKGGYVTFVAESGGGSASGPIDPKDGSFSIEKVPTGTVKVGVQSIDRPRPGPGGRPNKGPPTGATVGPPKDGPALPPGVDPKVFQPAASGATFTPGLEGYNDPDESGIKYTVKSGPQTWSIELPLK